MNIFQSIRKSNITQMVKYQFKSFIYYFLLVSSFRYIITLRSSLELSIVEILILYKSLLKFSDIYRGTVGILMDTIVSSEMFNARYIFKDVKHNQNELHDLLNKCVSKCLILSFIINIIFCTVAAFVCHFNIIPYNNIIYFCSILFIFLGIRSISITSSTLRFVSDGLSSRYINMFGIAATIIQVSAPLLYYKLKFYFFNSSIIYISDILITYTIAGVLSFLINYIFLIFKYHYILSPSKVDIFTIVYEMLYTFPGLLFKIMSRILLIEGIGFVMYLVYQNVDILEMSLVYEIYRFLVGTYDVATDLTYKVNAHRASSLKTLFSSVCFSTIIFTLLYFIMILIGFRLGLHNNLFYTQNKISIRTYKIFLTSLLFDVFSKPFEICNILNKKTQHYIVLILFSDIITTVFSVYLYKYIQDIHTLVSLAVVCRMFNYLIGNIIISLSGNGNQELAWDSFCYMLITLCIIYPVFLVLI